jgi:ABC-type bacteriocin/lantibiotic exporter with double-glycine peptidase domain
MMDIQTNSYQIIGVLVTLISLLNASIIFLIGSDYLKLLNNRFVLVVYAIALIYVSILLGFLTVCLIPSITLIYIYLHIKKTNKKIIKKTNKLEAVDEVDEEVEAEIEAEAEVKVEAEVDEEISEEISEVINDIVNKVVNDDIKQD